MRAEELLPIVAEWLKGAEFPALTPRTAALPAPLQKLTNILAVVGPRRAGKTYFLYQLIGSLLASGTPREEILFLDFEDYRLKEFVPSDIDALFTAFYRLAGCSPKYLFFDEVQHLPDWSRVLRTLHNRRKYVLVVTGSNSSLLSAEIATELRGRYENIRLMPFSFREYLAFRGRKWDETMFQTPERGRIIREFEDYLRFGGFPEVCQRETPIEKRKLLQNYYDTIFYKDILDCYRIKAVDLLDRLLGAVLTGSAELFSISAFEKQLKAAGFSGSKRTIAHYLRMLEEVFFLIINEKFSYSVRKRMMNPGKAYVLDAGFSLLSQEFSENAGKRLETCIAVEFYRREETMFYFKERQECDLILKHGTKPDEAWQVCWNITPHNEKREMGGLLEAMSVLGLKKGGLITFDQEGERFVDGRKIPLIPAWKWLLLK